MRYIHPVAPHEAFVASGTYRYESPPGTPTGLVEHWTIHEQPDGAWFMRVDKDGRDVDGRSELIEAWRSPAGSIERWDILASGNMTDDPRTIRATYTADEGILYVGRSLGGDSQYRSELELFPRYGVQPGSYLFFGFLLPSLTEGEPLPVVMRYGRTDDENAFDAVYSYPSVTFKEETTLLIDGKDRAARSYLAGARSDEGRTDWHTYWIDQHDIFLRHESRGLVVQLERYAHRPNS